MSSIEIQALDPTRKSDVEKFIDFAWQLYQPKNPSRVSEDMRGWIPPLRVYARDLLDVKKNPFYKRADLQLFLATRNGKPVGRIAAIDNRGYNDFHQDNLGHYGFYESENDLEVAQSLFKAVSEWHRARGRTAIQGPYNPSTNHECGLLVRGQSQFCTLMTTWNPTYYAELHEKAGLKAVKDLIAYWLPAEKIQDLKPGLLEKAKRARSASPYKFRDFDVKNFDRDVEICFEIYNSAWEKNWGFFPMTREEFIHGAKDMKMFLDPRMAFIAERNGKPAGFMLALPDFHHIYKRIPSGKLTPLAIGKILIGKRMLKTVRIMALGVKPEFRGGGIFAQFIAESFLRAHEIGLVGGEASWMLEDNEAINKPWRDLGAPLYRRWRIYEQAL